MQRARKGRPEPLADRELLTEAAAALLFVGVAIALIAIGRPGHFALGPAVVLLLAFTLLSRFEFETGAGYGFPASCHACAFKNATPCELFQNASSMIVLRVMPGTRLRTNLM